MYTDQRLFRSQAFEPVAALGDVVFLLDQTGPMQKYGTPFFWVKGLGAHFGATPHELLLLWSQSATAPAGYGTAPGNTNLIPEAQTGNIASGGSVSISNPKILQGAPLQLLQMRWGLKTLALTGIKEHDLELQVFMPGKTAMFGILNAAPGYYNMVEQFQDAADAVDSPAQNANQTLPAAFPALSPRDNANLTEMFLWEQSGPTFQIWNNGSASLTAGAIGLRVYGYRYDLLPVDARFFTDRRLVYGDMWKCPPTPREIPVIPTGAYTLQPGQQ